MSQCFTLVGLLLTLEQLYFQPVDLNEDHGHLPTPPPTLCRPEKRPLVSDDTLSPNLGRWKKGRLEPPPPPSPSSSDSTVAPLSLSTRTPPPPSSMGTSKRGVGLQWRTDAEVATRASQQQDTIRLISNLAATSVNILSNSLATPLFTQSSSISFISVPSQEQNSLRAIANRISNLERQEFNLNLGMVISLIQFALKLHILHKTTLKDFTALIGEEIQSGGELEGFSDHQGKRWRSWGSRLAEFAGASK